MIKIFILKVCFGGTFDHPVSFQKELLHIISKEYGIEYFTDDSERGFKLENIGHNGVPIFLPEKMLVLHGFKCTLQHNIGKMIGLVHANNLCG